MASLYIYKLKINAKLEGKSIARGDLSIHNVPTVSCVISEAKILFLKCFEQFKAKKQIEFAHVLKLSKLINLSVCYQNSSDMRFLQANRLYFNLDAFSCTMVLLTIFLSKTRITFIYVNITYVYVTEFMLADPT